MTAVPGVTLIDLAACLQAVNRQDAEGAVKITEDLDRYRRVIATDRPEVIVETGTYAGGSARWFAAQGVDVISVDKYQRNLASTPHIEWVIGDSADRNTVAAVVQAIAGRRTMVVLDSDHSAAHVRAEIAAYGPLVTVGCHLVVEDGIVRFMGSNNGSPLDAIEELLLDDPDWTCDRATELMHSVTMHPAGWWVRAR